MMNTAGTQISESSISTLDTDFDSISSNQPSLSDEKFNNLKEDFKDEEHRKDNDNFWKDTKEGNKKIDVHLRENEQNLNERTKSLSNAKETVVNKIFEKVQENNNTNSSGDWKDNVNVENHHSTLNNSQDNKQMRENVDRININEKREIFIEKKINDKTPLDILEDYANKCKINIQYHCEKNKCNRFVITGKLSEFSATDCGDTEILVKNNIAKIILQNIADHQMNDKDMKQLLELSREQILEIINFGKDDTIETPLRKVYMLCIKKGGPPPKYITEMKYRHEGVKFVAKCVALDHVIEGQGSSHQKAKKSAAEKFYEKYLNLGEDDDERESGGGGTEKKNLFST
ncbi:PREDICTED: uncharacterized protein DDB_G0287625-like [Polistes canadensis]|uniref:uncharacterized protein DDB_G0287625-like n=1 Tax=Polistes canadensis TaxID=91411 RepID=UPI000718E59B|nr:PREDICTED: uncharacterized protein DDB_G0287625-like [Polistes canadensis]